MDGQMNTWDTMEEDLQRYEHDQSLSLPSSRSGNFIFFYFWECLLRILLFLKILRKFLIGTVLERGFHLPA